MIQVQRGRQIGAGDDTALYDQIADALGGGLRALSHFPLLLVAVDRPLGGRFC